MRAFHRGHLIAQALGAEEPTAPVPPPAPPVLPEKEKAAIRQRYARGWSREALAALHRITLSQVAEIVRGGGRDADGLTFEERHQIITAAADGEELPDIAHRMGIPIITILKIVEKRAAYQ
jgi:hypothetical protein